MDRFGAMASPAKYHLEQFALKPDDPRRVDPEIPAECTAWLDVGCGAGATLQSRGGGLRLAIGVDPDIKALRLAHEMRVPAPVICSAGERLPFAASSFDFVSSRVALPYMNIRQALREFSRVLRPKGQVWLALHPLTRLDWKQAFGGPLHLAYEVYRLTNTAMLHVGLPQFRCPEARRRCESYQTDRGILRELRRAGFSDVAIRRTPHYVVTARKG